jgi:DNA-binding response OmpR family regulator
MNLVYGSPDGNRMRILIVEDERKVAEMVSRGLKAERYAVDVADNGDTGWAMAHTYDYDLVILDLGLPGMDGAELLRRIRGRNSRIPILILTARDATACKVDSFEAGADDYLTKPFAFAELAVRIKALLRRGAADQSSVMRVGDLEIDRLTQQVSRAGQRIELTAKGICAAGLPCDPPRAGAFADDDRRARLGPELRGAHQHRGRLRQASRVKVDDPFPVKLIRTVRGSGYRLTDEEAP